jgi:VWFA-related protein
MGLMRLAAPPVLLGALSAATLAQDAPSFSSRADLVVVHVTVGDRRGGYVTDLTGDAFSIFEDGTLQSLALFSREDRPAVVGLVIDNSGSMQPNRQAVISAGLAFARASHAEDELFTVNFNDRIWPGLPAGQAFTKDHGQLERALLSTYARGRTALYDAITYAVEHMEKRVAQKKVLILISDGADNASRTTLDEVLTRARQGDAVLYAVGLFDPLEAQSGKKVLRQLSRETGGLSFFPDGPDELASILERIALEIRSGYTIGYHPSNARLDGTYRRLRVLVRPPKGTRIEVRARDGYLAARGEVDLP